MANQELACTVRVEDGSYEIQTEGRKRIVRAIIAAQVDHTWIRSTDYPLRHISRSDFEDRLGHGHQIDVSFAGLAGRVDLHYVVRLYETIPAGDIQAQVRNHTGHRVTVQSIRVLEAIGEPILDLGGDERFDRVLSDSFSENRPALKIFDLGGAPGGLHRAVGSQLIYNRDSRNSLFWGALTSNRFLTIARLEVAGESSDPRIIAFNIDSTGTTELQVPSIFPDAPKEEDRIELSLPLDPEQKIESERVMFAAGSDYHSLLENYGRAIRKLHRARVSSDPPMGWWSWTAYYRDIDEQVILRNARWLARHLKTTGYDYFHIDSGYERAPGEYAIPDPSKFPRGMRPLTRDIARLGLRIGIWTAPFYVGENSWVAKQHKEWLVSNAQGVPIRILARAKAQEGEDIFVLDATHPGAQQYLRHTYRTIAKDWGAHYIKLDFMDSTAIEGHYHRPNTTALEAQRIGLGVIRKAAGEDVLLDKDGSPMLNPVGIVDEGRISQDTAHTFADTRDAAPGIAARYYMHRNFFVADPDAFNISPQVVGRRSQKPVTMNEAQVSIVLAVISGGMFEIGDDLGALASDPERLALATNPDLLRAVRLGKAFEPLDLMEYASEDEQPSVFLLKEDGCHWLLALFNWTEHPQSHHFALREIGLPTNQLALYDLLAGHQPIPFDGQSVVLNDQRARSVRFIQIVASPGNATASATAQQISGRQKDFRW